MFLEFPFYNTFIEKPLIKRLNNIDLLHKLQFYDELSTEKISKAFKTYAKNYRTETIHSKNPSVQLKTIESSIKDYFKDLLNQIKGFKYQITVKVLLRKHREYGDICSFLF